MRGGKPRAGTCGNQRGFLLVGFGLAVRVSELKVTNDAAERGVKNAQEVADVSRNPLHRENVMLVINDHRGRMARLRKADLNAINQ